MVAMKEFRAWSNRFTGPLPAAWGRAWGSVTRIDLDKSNLEGTLPPEWSQMKTLEVVNLSVQPRLSGVVPPSWGALPALKEVYLVDNPRMSGCLPAQWRTRLDKVNVTGSGITGFCP
jgi:hypothetical protein